MLGLRLKRGLKIVLLLFSIVAIVMIVYYSFAINSKIALLKEAASKIQDGMSSLVPNLTKISTLNLIETMLMLACFLVFAIALHYLLNWYFLEKRNALVDELTGLYNRKAMKLWLKKEISRAERFGHSLSMAMIDLDYFKKYNDIHGHLRGDWLLKEIAKLLKGNVREIDFVGRYGGEEFIIIFPETNHKNAVSISNRIRELIENTNFPGGETQPKGKITISMGLITFNKNFEEEDMIHKADALLYQAKASGRNLLVHKQFS